MPTPASNPISTAFAAIWSALSNWPQFTAIVLPGLGTTQNAQQPGFVPQYNAQAADRPAARLGEGRLMGRPYQRNSKAVEMVCGYPLQLFTDQSLGIDKINLLDVVVYQALMSPDLTTPNFPGTLGIPELVNKWEFSPGEIKTRDQLTKRPAWNSVLNIVVTMTIDRTAFLATTYT